MHKLYVCRTDDISFIYKLCGDSTCDAFIAFEKTRFWIDCTDGTAFFRQSP